MAKTTGPATPTIHPHVRNWLVARYLRDPAPGRWAGPPGGPVAFERFEVFADFLVGLGVDVLPTLDACLAAGWTDDVFLTLSLAEDPDPVPLGIQRLRLPFGRHRLVGIRPAVLEAVAPAPAPAGDAPNSLRARAEADPKARLKLAVYEAIRRRPETPANLLPLLRRDKQFQEMVRDAGLALNLKLIKAARRKPTAPRPGG